MNKSKLKAIFFLIIILLLVMIFVSSFFNDSDNNEANNQTEEDRHTYSFSETLDLDASNTFEESVTNETGEINFGIISDYYENADRFYKDDKLYINVTGGYDVYSKSWMDEGFAKYVKEPEFGILVKFVLKETSASARYNEVKMKDVVTYINELSGLGFNEILKDDQNKKNDYYIYSASKGDVTVTLNYEKGSLYMEIF